MIIGGETQRRIGAAGLAFVNETGVLRPIVRATTNGVPAMQATRRDFIAAALVFTAFAHGAQALAAEGRLSGTDHLGRAVTETSPGGWRLVMFGYTHCPDVCPIGLQTLAETTDALGPLGERITPVFVTVDPARDTPTVMKDFVSMFHPRMIGVTPGEAELATLAAAWRVKYARVESSDRSTYSMDHTATIFLVDPAGTIVRRLPYGAPAKDLADRVKAVFAAR